MLAFTASTLIALAGAIAVNAQAPAEGWDYIVIGAGASGIPNAVRLAERGNKVLLLERGGPSLYDSGGRFQIADWMKGYNLTSFDVWSMTPMAGVSRGDPAEPVYCNQPVELAACILGGGTAVNAGQHFRPPNRYWNKYYPEGWKAVDMFEANEEVSRRVPATSVTSTDGQEYHIEIYPVLSNIFKGMNFTEVVLENEWDKKEKVFGRDVFYTYKGQRGGPLRGYYLDRPKNEFLTLQMHTKVDNLIRENGVITGINATFNGQRIIYKAKAVVLAAGVFGTSPLLFNSGIGPKDQLELAATLGFNNYSPDTWIESPVGKGVYDNPTITVQIDHPAAQIYNASDVYWNPQDPMKTQLLVNRTGAYTFYGRVLVMFWDIPVGDTVINAQAICSPSSTVDKRINCPWYVGEGIFSNADVVYTPQGRINWRGNPYFSDPQGLDITAAAISLRDFLAAGKATDPDFKVVLPDPSKFDITNVDSLKAYINSTRTGNNHWQGSTKLGTDDGTKGGNAVVDTNCKVYGTDNLYITDAGIAPRMTTGNPVWMIQVFGEKCAERIHESRKAYPKSVA
ncbi:hypothetical protein BJ742DRAFT_741950 [Cladochytrium replicatum]|nr:hypothetical protein BJ742DRAFT_741950 [Cladochytrium replicatum]